MEFWIWQIRMMVLVHQQTLIWRWLIRPRGGSLSNQDQGTQHKWIPRVHLISMKQVALCQNSRIANPLVKMIYLLKENDNVRILILCFLQLLYHHPLTVPRKRNEKKPRWVHATIYVTDLKNRTGCVLFAIQCFCHQDLGSYVPMFASLYTRTYVCSFQKGTYVCSIVEGSTVFILLTCWSYISAVLKLTRC